MKNKIKATLKTKVKAQDASEMSLDDIQSQVASLAQSDSRFNNKPAGSVNTNCYVYPCGILTDGENFKAVISSCDGKYYEVSLNIEDGKVTSLGDDATAVSRKTMWVTASQKKGLCFNDELIVQAVGNSMGATKGSASKKSNAATEAAHEATGEAIKSGEDVHHEAASDAHEVAADAHETAMLAHAKAGDIERAKEHMTIMIAHQACQDAHDCKVKGDDMDDTKVEASCKALKNLVKAGGPGSGPHASIEDAADKSGDAFAATGKAKTAPEHLKAAELHEEAGKMNDEVFGEGEGDKNREMAALHREAAQKAGSNGRITLSKSMVKEMQASIRTSIKSKREIIHCRASGSKLPASEPWVQDEPVKFCYMPGGLHTINAGFCGPITKGRDCSINLSIDVEPDRDAPVCQASLDEMRSEAPKQDPYGCFEHDEKQASVWATEFESGEDPVHGEPAILLAGKPSRGGADAVNGKDWRSWSPSFGTDAEYGKCQCRHCDENIKACECDSPAFYFPEGARGSLSKPAKITGVDFVVGTLTNKPAFRAMPPVKAKEKVTAGGPGSGRHATGGETHEKALNATKKASLASQNAHTELTHMAARTAHSEAADANSEASESAKDAGKDELAKEHEDQAASHMAQEEYHSSKAASFASARFLGKNKASDSTELDSETILAGMPKSSDMDAILAGMPGARPSIAQELDEMDKILASMSGVKV